MNYLSKENVQELLGLSPVQEEICLGEQSATGHAIQVKYEIDGMIIPEKIQEAWNHVIKCHPALRTIFRSVKNRIYQVVLKNRPVDLECYDLREKKEDEIQRTIKETCERLRQPFILAEGPLMRLALFLISDTQAVLVWTYHQIILDPWSRGLILEDFAEAYEALAKGTGLSDTTRPAPKYLEWLAKQDWTPALDYWKQGLMQFEEPVLLHKDKIRGQHPKTPATISTELPYTLTEKMKKLLSTYGITAAAAAQAAWAIFMSVYSGEDRIAFGLLSPGRPLDLDGSAKMVGMFGGVYPQCIHVDGNQKVSDFLVDLDKKCRSLSGYSYIPLKEIYTYCNIPLSAELFESTLSISKPLMQQDRFRGLTIKPQEVVQELKHSLNVEITEGTPWTVGFTYDAALWEKDTAERMQAHFCTILESIADRPEDQISRLNLLSEQEKTKLFIDFNRSDSSPKLDRLAQQIIEEQAARTPEAIAAQCGADCITYKELNCQSNRLAHWLREREFGRNDLAAVFEERSINMLIGIIAVLKAGGAYVPLDPAQPDARLITIVDSSKAKIILTERKLKERSLSFGENMMSKPFVFALDDEDRGMLQIYSEENPTFINEPGDLANVFYTSGSTGQPKGAMIEHIGMLNHLWAKINLLGISEKSTVAQNASHCFDISVWQFLAPLMAGGRVVIYDNDIAGDPQELLLNIQKDGVTILELVPAMIGMLMQAVEGLSGENRRLPMLQYMISTGEALPAEVCAKWFRIYPQIKMVNTYGATECSDDTNHLIIEKMGTDDPDYMSLGTPIPNFKMYLLDRFKRPVPIGCVGEICLTGIGVGRGYTNAPEQTAAAFVSNPFDDGMGSRMYMTGDLGRFLPDGRLLFISRKDFQVKVRGHRIELGEIEAVLLKYGGMKQCAAIIRKDSTGQNRILAYAVLESPIQVSVLRQFLQEHLPEYMIPEHIIILNALPLNRNGKIDRKALPEPETKVSRVSREMPRNATEAALVEIWEEVLEAAPIGIDDNFFALGGHSLKTIQVRSRIRQQFDIDISLKMLFEYQTVSALAAVIEAAKEDTRVAPKEAIMKYPKAEYYPLSNAQSRLYFLHRLEPDDDSYNMPVVFDLIGIMDEASVRRSFETIRERHDVLRAVFGMIDGRPVQRILDNTALAYQYVDLTSFENAVRKQKLDLLIENEVKSFFNLETGPLFRTMLIKLEDRHSVLIINMHHAISDAWSWQILKREFSALYQAYSKNLPNPLEPLTIQYTDYVCWFNERLRNGQLEAAEKYWLDQFAGEIPVLSLPTDYPRPAIQTHKGRTQVMRLDSQLSAQIKALCQKQDATLFMILLTASGILLSKLSGQEDIIIGIPEAGRNQVELEDLIGFFINTLALRLDMSGDPGFEEMLKRIKAKALDAYSHQEYPFDLLVEKINPVREMTESPIFSTMFQSIERTQFIDFAIEGVEIQKYSVENNSMAFDQAITFQENEDGITFYFEAKSDLYADETITRWMGYMKTLLEQICSNPKQKISEMPLLSTDERQRILEDWNNTKADYPNMCIHQLFEKQVESTPNNTAIVYEERHLTYQELNQKANQLARRLRDKGVGADSTVGILVGRSPEMMIGILGILKAGGAYVPIASDYPQDRIEYIIEDSKAHIVLTQSDIKEKAACAEHLILLDDESLYRGDNGNPEPKSSSDNLAYVMYTSGTTGRPKGVMIEHRGVVNLCTWMNTKYDLQANKNIMQIASICFDVSVEEAIGTLTNGATLYISDKETILDKNKFYEFVNKHQINMVQLVPATLRQLILENKYMESLHIVICGSDRLEGPLKDKVLERGYTLYNCYGPTEITVDAVTAKCEKGKETIGKPIANAKAYIVDKYNKPQPVGIVGELCIGGAGLARGYLNKPDLTALKFIANPFIQGERMYKTGDLARWLPDGNIEYLGRIDNQVKIRGFRIELGEIENILLKKPSIKEAVVEAKEDPYGGKCLIAYIVPREGHAPTAGELHDYLKEQLPDYMIPSRFIQLPKLPLTPNGKTDRRALPEPDSAFDEERKQSAPRDSVEFEMLEIWRQVLKTASIGIFDNFFTIGGHSIIAMVLNEKIREHFKVELPLSTLFQLPTIAQLSDRIRENVKMQETCLVKMQKGTSSAPPLFLIHPHGGGVFCYFELVKALGPEDTIYGIQAVGLDSDQNPLSSIYSIAERYLEEIKSAAPKGPYRMAGWSFGGIVAYEIARRLEALGEKVVFLGMLDVAPLSQCQTDSDEKIDQEKDLPMLIKYAQLMGMEKSQLEGLDEEEAFVRILAHAKRMNLFPQSTAMEMMRKKIKVMMANSVALEEYICKDKIQSDIHLFYVTETNEKDEQPLINPEDWAEYTAGQVHAAKIPGNHQTLVESPFVYKLAESIRDFLNSRGAV